VAVGTPKAEMKRWRQEITEVRDWRQVRDGIEVRICPAPDGQELFLVCRSRERKEKESAIHERFIERMESGLGSVQRRIERARKRIDRDQVLLQFGRLCGQNSRAAGRYQIRVVDAPEARPACVWSGVHDRSGTSKRGTARAVTCCAPT
jgi:ribosomal protein L44E